MYLQYKDHTVLPLTGHVNLRALTLTRDFLQAGPSPPPRIVKKGMARPAQRLEFWCLSPFKKRPNLSVYGFLYPGTWWVAYKPEKGEGGVASADSIRTFSKSAPTQRPSGQKNPRKFMPQYNNQIILNIMDRQNGMGQQNGL
jgi:hypothetical protein